jgi:hypothetical protein
MNIIPVGCQSKTKAMKQAMAAVSIIPEDISNADS